MSVTNSNNVTGGFENDHPRLNPKPWALLSENSHSFPIKAIFRKTAT